MYTNFWKSSERKVYFDIWKKLPMSINGTSQCLPGSASSPGPNGRRSSPPGRCPALENTRFKPKSAGTVHGMYVYALKPYMSWKKHAHVWFWYSDGQGVNCPVWPGSGFRPHTNGLNMGNYLGSSWGTLEKPWKNLMEEPPGEPSGPTLIAKSPKPLRSTSF